MPRAVFGLLMPKPTISEQALLSIAQSLRTANVLFERMTKQMATSLEIQEGLLREVQETGASSNRLLADVKALLAAHAAANPGIDLTKIEQASATLDGLQQQNDAASAAIEAALAPPAQEPAPVEPARTEGA